MRCYVAAGIVSALCCASVVRAEDSPPLLTVEVRGISALVQDVNRVAIGLQLGPQGVLLAQMLDQSIGGNDFAGIDTNGVLRAYLFTGEDQQSPAKAYVVTLPARDGAGSVFMDALTNALKRGENDGGVTRFSRPDYGMPGSDIFVGLEKGQIVVGPDHDRVSAMMEGLAAGTYDPAQRTGISGTIALDLNVPAVAALMARTLDKAAATMAGLPKSGVNEGMDVAGVLKAEGEWLRGVLDQIDVLQFGLGTDAKSLVMYSRMVAKPDTAIARICQGSHAPRADFMGLLPEDLMFTQVGHLGDVDAFLDLYADFATEVMGSMGSAGQGFSGLLAKSVEDMRGLATGDYALGVGLDPVQQQMQGVYYFGVTDPARAQTVMEHYVAQFAAQTNVFPGMDVRVTAEPGRDYNGVAISRHGYHLSMESAMPPGVPMPPIMNQMTNMMYEWAIVGDVAVVAMGNASLMNASLDRLKTPGRSILDSAMFQSLFAGDTQAASASEVVNLSLVSYMKFVVSMLPGMGAQNLDMIPASGSGMSGYSLAAGNGTTGVAKLGIAEIVTIKSMIPFLMMSGMGAGGGAHGGRMDEDMDGGMGSEDDAGMPYDDGEGVPVEEEQGGDGAM